MSIAARDAPGRFAYHVHRGPDPQAAAAFYAELASWTVAPGPGASALISSAEGELVGEFALETELDAHWLPYVVVSELDAARERVLGLGGTLDGRPGEPNGVRRSLVLADPLGARLGLFEPQDQTPLPVSGFAFNELVSSAPQRSVAFWSAVAGWEPAASKVSSYGGVIRLCAPPAPLEERFDVASCIEIYPGLEGEPSQWVSVIDTVDVPARTATARALGAEVLADCLSAPGMGPATLLRDPVGAAVELWDPRSYEISYA